MTLVRNLAAATLTFAALSALAQNIKPGLWEMQSKMKIGGMSDEQQKQMEAAQAQMAQQMAAMPAEQRKMIESMMSKQGVNIAPGKGGGMAIRMCMTKEMVERRELHAQRGNCSSKTSGISGNTMKVNFSCTDPVSSGEGTYTFDSPESYSMQMTITSQQEGKPHQMNMSSSGKWLGSDCGDIKPMVLPKN